MDWEILRIPLMMVGGVFAAILLLMLVAKLTSMVSTEEKQGKKKTVQRADYQSKWPVDASPTIDQINSSQVTSCFARVITKRTPGGSEYYIGFEMEDGERIELRVQGSQYGVIIEGDQGMVSFRDGRMVAFDRTGAVPRKA